ncbi:MAG: hypothetical protein H6948_01725 [Zoogloeaceae bacterium]|nr:hypothetical protein [Zoogloeaceae bacterium]
MRKTSPLTLLLAGILATGSASAFERVKMSDGELSCEQLYAEAEFMGSIAGDAADSRDTANAISTGTAVGQNSLGLAATAAAWGGAGSAVGGIAQIGGLASMFGGAANTYASYKGQSAEINLEDARARKAHLTELFIKRDCKVSGLDQEQLAVARQEFAVTEQAEAQQEKPKSGFGLW